jgi:type II secretory pathway pseudopilin PulG
MIGLLGLYPQRYAGSRTHRSGGFTLMEVMLAACILVVALLGVAGVLPTSKGNVHRAGQISKAAWLAQEMVEMIKNDPFNQLNLYNGVDTRNTATYPIDSPIPPVAGATGNFSGGSNVAKWANDIAVFLAVGSGVAGGYGIITVSDVTCRNASNTIVACGGTNEAILRKVSVEVHWTEAGKAVAPIKLETLASNI